MRLFNIHGVHDFNTKPVYEMALNHTHDLVNKMRHCFAFQEVTRSPPTAIATGYVTYDHLTEMVFGTRNVYQIPRKGRMCGYFNGSGTGIPITNAGLNEMPPLEDRLTVYSRVWYESLAQDHTLFDVNDQTLTFWADTTPSPDKLGGRIYPGSGGPTGTAGLLDSPPWVSWGGVVESNGASQSDCYLYVGGKLDASSLAQGTDGFSGANRYRFGVNYSGGTKVSNANYEYIYFWDKSLSAEEIKSINDYPYQIFKRKIPITYFIPAATGGPTVIPPSMHGIENQFNPITAARLGGVLEQ